MEKKKISKSPFAFRNFIVAESNIRLEPNANFEDIDFNIEPIGQIDYAKKIFELQLEIKLLAKDNSFETRVLIVGFFEFKNEESKETLSNYFFTNAPAMLFPYVRSYIACLTALSGIETLLLPPLNLTSLGKDLESKTITLKDDN